VTSSALQSRKWQLIGMSQWCHSALCGHPLPALTDSWTHGAASRHPIALISHTRPSTRSCSYYVCLMTTLFQHQHTAPRMCNSWTAALRNAKLFLRPTCGLQTAQISVPVDYEIWAVMQRRVYHRQIHSVDELKRRFIDVRCGLEQSIFDETIDETKTSGVCPCQRRTFLVQPVNWRCWFCPYLLCSMWFVWLFHL